MNSIVETAVSIRDIHRHSYRSYRWRLFKVNLQLQRCLFEFVLLFLDDYRNADYSCQLLSSRTIKMFPSYRTRLKQIRICLKCEHCQPVFVFTFPIYYRNCCLLFITHFLVSRIDPKYIYMCVLLFPGVINNIFDKLIIFRSCLGKTTLSISKHEIFQQSAMRNNSISCYKKNEKSEASSIAVDGSE